MGMHRYLPVQTHLQTCITFFRNKRNHHICVNPSHVLHATLALQNELFPLNANAKHLNSKSRNAPPHIPIRKSQCVFPWAFPLSSLWWLWVSREMPQSTSDTSQVLFCATPQWLRAAILHDMVAFVGSLGNSQYISITCFYNGENNYGV